VDGRFAVSEPDRSDLFCHLFVYITDDFRPLILHDFPDISESFHELSAAEAVKGFRRPPLKRATDPGTG